MSDFSFIHFKDKYLTISYYLTKKKPYLRKVQQQLEFVWQGKTTTYNIYNSYLQSK